MLSAVGQDKITQKAVGLGAEYYVVKPFDIELLIKRIKELKNFKPSQNVNNFIKKDVKTQYFVIPADSCFRHCPIPHKIRSTLSDFATAAHSTRPTASL